MASYISLIYTYESSNPGSTHFRSQTEFQSTNECGLSQPGLQSGLGEFTLEANSVESGLEPSCKQRVVLLYGLYKP